MKNTDLLSPQSQLEEILFGMKLIEVNYFLNELKHPRNEYLNFLPIRWKIISLAQNGFYFTLYKFYEKYKEGEDKVKAIEEVLDKMSHKLCEHIVKLEFGIVAGSVGIRLHRLPYNFGKLKNLRKLYLNQQPIDDFTPLKDLRLEFLCAEGCHITDPSPVNLEHLYWYNLQFSTVKDVSYLKTGALLGWLKLAKTQIDQSQIDNIIRVENLTQFDISACNNLKDLPPEIGPFVGANGDYVLKDKDEITRRKKIMSQVRKQHVDYFFCDIMAF